AQTLDAANVSASKSRDLAAAGAMLTLAAGIGAEAPLFKLAKMATVTEDMLTTASLTSMQEALPAMVATSLLVASAMGAANQQLPSEEEGRAGWLQELNATAQKMWESGTGSLNTQATTLLREVGKLWAAFDGQLSVEEVEAGSEAKLPDIGIASVSRNDQGCHMLQAAAAAAPVADSSRALSRCLEVKLLQTPDILTMPAWKPNARWTTGLTSKGS
ncbi:ANKRD17, partial [Symbiodinium necroappetens]